MINKRMIAKIKAFRKADKDDVLCNPCLPKLGIQRFVRELACLDIFLVP